jgi:hypothetical protein
MNNLFTEQPGYGFNRWITRKKQRFLEHLHTFQLFQR